MFNAGPSQGFLGRIGDNMSMGAPAGFRDKLRQKSRGNTGITGGMNRGPVSPGPIFAGPMGPVLDRTNPGQGNRGSGQPVSRTMPVPFDRGMGMRPSIQPPAQEGIDLWRTFNRLQGGMSAGRPTGLY